MIPAVLEKALWMLTLAVLYEKGQVTGRTITANAATHGLLGVLFIVAFVITPRASGGTSRRGLRASTGTRRFFFSKAEISGSCTSVRPISSSPFSRQSRRKGSMVKE